MKTEDLLKWFFYIVIATLFGLLLLSAASCEVLKTKQSKAIDSTAVHKVDSGLVSGNTNTKTDSSGYRREIWTFGRDTNVTVNNIYPTSYIREEGTQVVNQREVNYDSLWYNRLDSLNRRTTEDTKTKETSPAKFIQIAIGMGLVFVGLVMLGALVLLGIKIYRTFKI